MDDSLSEYEVQMIEEAVSQEPSPVQGVISFRKFVSRSKGRRKDGSKRYRKRVKEVFLVSNRDGSYFSCHKFPFDVYATEILGPKSDGEDLKSEIIRVWGY